MNRFVILSLLAVLSVHFSFASEKIKYSGIWCEARERPNLKQNKSSKSYWLGICSSPRFTQMKMCYGCFGNPVDCLNQLLTMIMCKQVFKNKITCNIKEILLIFVHYILPSELIASELSSPGWYECIPNELIIVDGVEIPVLVDWLSECSLFYFLH